MFAVLLSLFAAAPPIQVSLDVPGDSAAVVSAVRVVEVRDLRRLATLSPQAIGVSTVGVFEERIPLQTVLPVAQEVQALCNKWLKSTERALPVRVELLSFESWSVPTDGPDPFYAVAKLRVVSVDSVRPGLLLEPEAKSERKGLTSATDQARMLASCLRDALAMVRADMKPVPGETPKAIPSFDPWADPRKGGARDTLGLRLQHSVSLLVSPAWESIQMGLRYEQHLAGQTGWERGYWGGLQVRGPWTDSKVSSVWAGEIAGGESWWRRLDDGRSRFSTVFSVGGLFGFERFHRVYQRADGTDSAGAGDWWIHPGAEGRAGLRWSESEGSGWLFEGGAFAAVRIPSTLGWFDPGLYGMAGWRF
jgi:hypothetical protein